MKQRKKVAKRKASKRARSRGRPAYKYSSELIINEDEMMNQVEKIVKALVDISHGDIMADVQSDELIGL